jgi:hypothetical protein
MLFHQAPFLRVIPTDRCDLRCRYCFQHDPDSPEMSRPDFEAVRLEACQGALVTGCVFEQNFRAVQDVGSTRLTITKCRIARCTNHSILLSENGGGGGSAQAVVSKSRISDSGGAGVRVAGVGIRIDGNTIAGTGAEGITVDGSGETAGVVISKNRVSDTTDSGIRSTRDTRVE